MKTKHFFYLVLFLLILSIDCIALAAPDLTAGQKEASAGQTISIPIDFASDGSSAHIQFDLFYDAQALTPGTPTVGSDSSGHVVASNEVGPGHYRFVVYSLSNASLDSYKMDPVQKTQEKL